jgi:hypothetical protein
VPVNCAPEVDVADGSSTAVDRGKYVSFLLLSVVMTVTGTDEVKTMPCKGRVAVGPPPGSSKDYIPCRALIPYRLLDPASPPALRGVNPPTSMSAAAAVTMEPANEDEGYCPDHPDLACNSRVDLTTPPLLASPRYYVVIRSKCVGVWDKWCV